MKSMLGAKGWTGNSTAGSQEEDIYNIQHRLITGIFRSPYHLSVLVLLDFQAPPRTQHQNMDKKGSINIKKTLNSTHQGTSRTVSHRTEEAESLYRAVKEQFRSTIESIISLRLPLVHRVLEGPSHPRAPYHPNDRKGDKYTLNVIHQVQMSLSKSRKCIAKQGGCDSWTSIVALSRTYQSGTLVTETLMAIQFVVFFYFLNFVLNS